jgi:hypothetical protein
MVVENGNQKLDLAGRTATTTGMLTTGNVDLNANGVAIINIKSLASANGTWSIDENGRIVGKVICLEDVCIDKNTLTNMLNISGQTGTVLGTSTTTTPPETGTTLTGTSTETSTSTTTDTAPVSTSTSTEEVVATSTSPAPVVDTIAPVITIVGGSSVTSVVGSSYSDQGATAHDDIDGDITSKIVPTSTVDTSTIGSYSVNYSVTDIAGNSTTVTRVVDVIADTTAVVTVPVEGN